MNLLYTFLGNNINQNNVDVLSKDFNVTISTHRLDLSTATLEQLNAYVDSVVQESRGYPIAFQYGDEVKLMSGYNLIYLDSVSPERAIELLK